MRVVIARPGIRKDLSTGSFDAFGIVFVHLPHLFPKIEAALLLGQSARFQENLGHIGFGFRVDQGLQEWFLRGRVRTD